MSLSRTLRIGALGALALGFTLATAPGCSSDDKGSATGGAGGSTGGSGGATGGSGGSTGGSGGGTGGMGGGGAVTPAFMAVAPCSTEGDYMKNVTTINATPVLKYSPSCVQIKKGSMITFMMDFMLHPLKKSAMRGSTADNPIMDTATGNSTNVTFPKSGFYAFYCSIHGNDATGANMTGVIWVTD